ncbi:lysine histidine transporter-like 8 [Pyrus ussuriensis x Pyrus communis]|uniref:Lysine histidine transporter-like 8 n=1 Tax=Pyrus ussuriensis x Pyrus communis TaxID=2448454 RepID=A0A5N5I970_9ROSA|nr:lysine histidine transporter-like 8 [Pyrus ussuriensis x Pyrus communis]
MAADPIGEVIVEISSYTTRSSASAQVFPDTTSPSNLDITSTNWECGELNPQDAWLPITESRSGNTYYATFHLLSSGIGTQALLLPLAFATLGWPWGIICFSLAFVWQIYTKWLLVHLHESENGFRNSRYLHLAVTAFGKKLGMILAMFPVIYQSNGTCAQLIIVGGGTLKLFFRTVCEDGATCHPLTGTECFLLFTCMAVVLAQFPNLNSVARLSLIGAVASVVYCTTVWTLSVGKGRDHDYTSYDPPAMESTMDIFGGKLNAVGIIFLTFRGHNVILEIQGTLPSNPRYPIHKRMWRGVTIAYALIAVCFLPLAIGGFWAFGNKVPTSYRGVLILVSQFHGHKNTSNFVLGSFCMLVVIHCLSTFQIYGMVAFDSLESKYTIRKNKPCPRWLRVALRIFSGGVEFFIAVALPFLGSLAPLIGGLTLPLAYAYPCFMWISIKKPKQKGAVWWINIGLGCLGLALSVILVVAAAWNLADKGLNANFFKP